MFFTFAFLLFPLALSFGFGQKSDVDDEAVTIGFDFRVGIRCDDEFC
jgi:hypothetical protein